MEFVYPYNIDADLTRKLLACVGIYLMNAVFLYLIQTTNLYLTFFCSYRNITLLSILKFSEVDCCLLTALINGLMDL